VTHAASLGLLAAVATWARPAHPTRGVWRFSLALSLAAVALAFRPGAANDSAAGVDTAGERPVTFAVYAAGLLDWRVPDSSAVGLHYAGMFGLFRRSLGRHAADTGGEVVLLESSAGPAITPGDLDQAAVAIFINPTRVPGAGEVECLRAYVEAGGGLLVLGDHTDIGGSRAALNAVLSFAGIRFNFDSAVPLRHNWQGCLEVRPHPITRRLGEPPGSELRAQLAVGASLAVTGPAKSLVLGRYAFADRGDSLNGGAAAFLGDLVRDRREAVGDVALVAAQQVGRGRVLVFGDTSPFQNGALFLSMDLVSDAVTWVCWPRARRYLDLAPYPEAAAVDFSLHPRARAALFADESLGGLANCLARLGMTARPVFTRDQWDQAGSHLFVVAPSRMDGLDVELLLRYVDAGGNLVLCQGYAPSQPCRRLLAALGMRIACIPLGNGDGRFPIAHRDAWALECVTLPDEASPPAGGPQPGGDPIVAGADTTVLASAFGYPTVVSRPYGRGTATVVSDGGFLLDCNLEGERSANTLNIALLGRLLGRRQPSQVD